MYLYLCVRVCLRVRVCACIFKEFQRCTLLAFGAFFESGTKPVELLRCCSNDVNGSSSTRDRQRSTVFSTREQKR